MKAIEKKVVEIVEKELVDSIEANVNAFIATFQEALKELKQPTESYGSISSMCGFDSHTLICITDVVQILVKEERYEDNVSKISRKGERSP